MLAAEATVNLTAESAVRTSGSILLGAATLTLSCARYPRPSISLEDGARTPNPGFIIEGPEAPHFITVERTSGQPGRAGAPTFWRLVRRGDTTVTPPVRLVYGVVPPGYHASDPASLLFPASYRISATVIHATASRTFTVADDGSVR